MKATQRKRLNTGFDLWWRSSQKDEISGERERRLVAAFAKNTSEMGLEPTTLRLEV